MSLILCLHKKPSNLFNIFIDNEIHIICLFGVHVVVVVVVVATSIYTPSSESIMCVHKSLTSFFLLLLHSSAAVSICLHSIYILHTRTHTRTLCKWDSECYKSKVKTREWVKEYHLYMLYVYGRVVGLWRILGHVHGLISFSYSPCTFSFHILVWNSSRDWELSLNHRNN